MPDLPIYLAAGQVAVYGMGSATSPNGIENVNPNGNLRWGNVYQIWSGGENYIYGGDSIMFDNNDVRDRVVYGGIPYTIVPARLVTKQNPLS